MILWFLVFMGSSFFFRSVILSRRRRISFYTGRDPSLALRMTLSSREGQLIKPLRVAEEDRVLVCRAEVRVLAQLFQLMLAGLRIDFVWIVGGEHIGLVAGDAHGFGDAQLLALAADEDAAFVDLAHNIVDDFFAFLQLQKAAARIVLHVTFPG